MVLYAGVAPGTPKHEIPLYKKIVAGAGAGALSSAVANPTDLVKVRLQTDGQMKGPDGNYLPKKYTGMGHAFSSIVKDEGVLGLWKGVGPTCGRATALAAAELATYDEVKWARLHPRHRLCECLHTHSPPLRRAIGGVRDGAVRVESPPGGGGQARPWISDRPLRPCSVRRGQISSDGTAARRRRQTHLVLGHGRLLRQELAERGHHVALQRLLAQLRPRGAPCHHRLPRDGAAQEELRIGGARASLHTGHEHTVSSAVSVHVGSRGVGESAALRLARGCGPGRAGGVLRAGRWRRPARACCLLDSRVGGGRGSLNQRRLERGQGVRHRIQLLLQTLRGGAAQCRSRSNRLTRRGVSVSK
eukprot:scaffold13627_cov109-Isochrysis_galbana.AAC.4